MEKMTVKIMPIEKQGGILVGAYAKAGSTSGFLMLVEETKTCINAYWGSQKRVKISRGPIEI
jgi:hypothetical protein